MQVRVRLVQHLLGKDPDKVRDNQVRVPTQVKVLMAKDLGKVKGHQARVPTQARFLQDKDPLGRPPGKVRVTQATDPRGDKAPNLVKVHQVKAPNRLALPSKKVHLLNKDLGPNSKGHQALGLILENQQRAEVLLVSRWLESPAVDSVHCVRPPS